MAEKEQGVSMIALTRFDLNDGRRMTKDTEFLAASETEAAALESRRLAVRGGSASETGLVAPAETTAQTDDATSGPSLKELEKSWTLAQDPETYLERFPDGPNAEAAQKIVAARRGR